MRLTSSHAIAPTERALARMQRTLTRDYLHSPEDRDGYASLKKFNDWSTCGAGWLERHAVRAWYRHERLKAVALWSAHVPCALGTLVATIPLSFLMDSEVRPFDACSPTRQRVLGVERSVQAIRESLWLGISKTAGPNGHYGLSDGYSLDDKWAEVNLVFAEIQRWEGSRDRPHRRLYAYKKVRNAIAHLSRETWQVVHVLHDVERSGFTRPLVNLTPAALRQLAQEIEDNDSLPPYSQ